MKDIRQKVNLILYMPIKTKFDKSQYKLSYFKYYERFNWIIAVGIYTDDMKMKFN